MKVGLDSYTIGCFHFNATQVIEWAKAHNCDGVQFGTPWELSANLDEGEIQEFCAHAHERGMYLEVGVPSVNPHRPNNRVRELGEGDSAKGFAKLLRLCALVGAKGVRAFIGGQPERYDEKVPWLQMQADTAAFLKQLAPVARDLGIKLGLETHADATTFEHLRIIESVGADVIGITLDTGNLTMRLEEPLAAVQRAAPHVVCTHTKDSILFFGDDGLRWQARPCGSGIVPFRQVLRELAKFVPDLTLSIEDHPRIYPLPIFQREWLASYVDLTPHDLAALVRLARETERRIAAGELSDPQQEETVAWEEKVAERVNAATGFLKGLLREEGL